jgi:glycosyltransferase involved in cell wall biosynthesis
MRIAFYAGSCLPIHARSLDERPLGGTETALIRLAEVLQSRGHDVSVFTAHKNPLSGPVRYLPAAAVFASGVFELFVCVKDWRPAVRGAPGKRFFFWTGDGAEQYINFGIGDARAAGRIEKLLVVSNWQKESLCSSSGFPPERAHVISNGVHLPYFAGAEQRTRKRLVYTSAPYRGLRFVPEIYRRLRSRHPDAVLEVFSGLSVYDSDQPFRGPHVADFEQIKRELSSLEGCRIHGNILQAALARELMKSSLFMYPNSVFETFCITALEALAAGCPVIASANSALPETLGDAGIVIQGQPGSEDYTRSFVAAADKLLSDDASWQRYSAAGIARVQQGFSWEHVADKFEALL